MTRRLKERHFRAQGPIILVLFIFVGLSGCAKVGDPLPPEITVPEPVADFQIYQQGADTLTLAFTLPPGDLRELEVLRVCRDGEAETFRRLPVGDLRPFPPGDRSRALDLILPEHENCRYSVRVRNSQGTRSSPTPEVAVQWGDPPACPEDVEVTVFPDHLQVQWKPPAASPAPVLAYLVDSHVVVNEPRFRVENFTFGESRSILVQSVSRTGNPMVVSSGCPSLTVTPQDTFAPPAPDGLRAVRVREGVQLVWDAAAAADVAGYRIYRLDRFGRQVVADLVPASQYLDRGAPVGVEVEYEVSAVDRAGNESPPSASAQVASEP